VKLTLRHRFAFARPLSGGLHSPEAWDALRDGDDIFGLPTSRAEWKAAASRSGLERRAASIARVADGLGARRVCSYGVGTGMLEWNLRRVAPHLELACTDFAPLAVARLASHFDGVPVVEHDLRKDPPREAELHLLNRVDTELSDEEWPAVLARFREPILLIATEIVGPRAVARELAIRVRHPGAERAGWIRTEDAFRALWTASHDDARLELAGLTGYLLTPRVRPEVR
jgi:hypothetical protein